MWNSNVEPDRPQMRIWRMLIACWIFKATNTHSEFVRLLTFPLLHWFHEGAPALSYVYIGCFVITEMECAYCAVRTCVYIHTYIIALQAGSSRVRFSMVSLKFFIDIILPTALWPCGQLRL